MRYAKLAPSLLVIAAIALAVAYFAAPASAETITVTRDDDPTPDGCANNGCSFREAADQADSMPGNQIVDVASGMTVVLENQINLSGDLTISGHGSDVSIIRTSNGSQLFNIASGADVTFNGVWIYGANIHGAGDCGGAIYNEGTLHIAHAKVAKNSITGNGAGLCNNGVAFLDFVEMSANTADDGPGGAIFNGGTITITNSEISHNNVHGVGGGGDGGGIANGEPGTMTIQNSVISDNTADSPACNDCSSGGGITSDGALTLEYSTISDNNADNAAGLENGGDATIRRSTFTGNQAGAISNSHGTMSINYSTISGNLASPYPDSGVGGISNYATLSLTNVTIADNTNLQFLYGGLFNNTTASVDYKATIFSNNGPKNCSTAGSQSSLGYNVYAPAAAACASLGTDQAVADAMLGPLQDNGGPTLTRLPLAGSPAINAGGPSCPGFEQRQAPHVNGCDVGAVEYGSTAPTATASPTQTAEPDGYPMGDNTCTDSVTLDDLGGALRLVTGFAAPDQCGRTTLPCFDYNGLCYPPWDDTNCDNMITTEDVLPILRYLAELVPQGSCTDVGSYIGHN